MMASPRGTKQIVGAVRERTDDGIDLESFGHRGRVEVWDRRLLSYRDRQVSQANTRKLPSTKGRVVARQQEVFPPFHPIQYYLKRTDNKTQTGPRRRTSR